MQDASAKATEQPPADQVGEVTSPNIGATEEDLKTDVKFLNFNQNDVALEREQRVAKKDDDVTEGKEDKMGIAEEEMIGNEGMQRKINDKEMGTGDEVALQRGDSETAKGDDAARGGNDAKQQETVEYFELEDVAHNREEVQIQQEKFEVDSEDLNLKTSSKSLSWKDVEQHASETDDDVAGGKKEKTAIREDQMLQNEGTEEQKMMDEEMRPGDEFEPKMEYLEIASQPENKDAITGGNDAEQQLTSEGFELENVKQQREREQKQQGEGFEVENEDAEAASQQNDEDEQTQVVEQERKGETAATSAIVEDKKLEDDGIDNSEKSTCLHDDGPKGT